MPKYRIKMSCGHVQEVTVSGSANERERQISYLERFGDCDECIERKREKDMLQAQEEAIGKNWPALTGTEKQIKWAEVIRKTKIRELEEFVTIFCQANITEAGDILRKISRNSSAKWWIEHRNSSARNFFRVEE